MNCKQAQEKIEVYLDRELTLSDRRDFEEHLEDCKNCQKMLDNLRSLSTSIQQTNYIKAPFSLRRKIKSELRDVTGEENARYGWTHLLGSAAGSAILASLAVWAMMTYIVDPDTTRTQLITELTTAHVRSLMVDHATDIITSDEHTVKPWFSGKLDFSPPIKDLSAEGFGLVGGRLDYLRLDDLQQRPAAVLVYKRRSHTINVFIYRSTDSEENPRLNKRQRQSYNLINWHKQGLSYWAVSDLNATELQQFAQLLRS